MGHLAEAGIVLLFFLHGAKLSRDAIWQGLRNWPLHLAVSRFDFCLFPAIGLGMVHLPGMDPAGRAGILFLTCCFDRAVVHRLPPPCARQRGGGDMQRVLLQSPGHRADPALVALVMHGVGGAGGGSGVSLASIEGILLQCSRRSCWVTCCAPGSAILSGRHKSLVTMVDRGSICWSSTPPLERRWSRGLWSRVCRPAIWGG